MQNTVIKLAADTTNLVTTLVGDPLKLSNDAIVAITIVVAGIVVSIGYALYNHIKDKPNWR